MTSDVSVSRLACLHSPLALFVFVFVVMYMFYLYLCICFSFIKLKIGHWFNQYRPATFQELPKFHLLLQLGSLRPIGPLDPSARGTQIRLGSMQLLDHGRPRTKFQSIDVYCPFWHGYSLRLVGAAGW